MVYPKAPFCHQFFQIAIIERIPQIPTNTQQDHCVLKRSFLEYCWPTLTHSAHLISPTSAIGDTACARGAATILNGLTRLYDAGTAEEFRLASLGSFQQLFRLCHIRAIKRNEMQKKRSNLALTACSSASTT
jgi:hypothetical protein